jgi:hypothetical protein
MPSRRAAKTPMLTEKMKSERFKFESTHKHWTYEDKSTVMFMMSHPLEPSGPLWAVCAVPQGDSYYMLKRQYFLVF